MKKRNPSISPFFFCHLSFFICLLSFFLFSCQKSTNPVQTGSLNMELLDVTCTEAFLGVEFDPGYVNKTLNLYRNDSLIENRPLSAADTILLAEGLWPNTSYEFRASITEGEKRLVSSAPLRVTTMDTTSHDFTWQSWEFGGQGGSSVFYDVAIIDENDIWAVGEIYTADDKYNAAHWDGEKWELKKLDWDGIVSRLTCVFAFSSDDVWFGVTNLIHWNGFTFEKNWNPVLDEFYDKTINKIWGTSSEDLYVVGNKGLIAHYDGREWRRVESGTEMDIQDIWGTYNNNKNNYEIMCIASNKYNGDDRLLIKLSDIKSNRLNAKGLPWSLSSIWFKNVYNRYVCGDGIFKWNNTMNTWIKKEDGYAIYKHHIRGQNSNDLALSGSYGLLVHFNGLTWKKELPIISRNFYSLDFNKNIIVAVGGDIRKARIALGRR
ncbi:MAG TPA: glucosyl transferase [Caldithrix abyssi]|uniref:Glucosyl transferase n=1 Tax=Caldithrix abyssi TaxID=187145 RepID=A0A7V4WTJ4_CALAY|nr:glucosyl transferase [Caldithrix abyssi]